MDIFSIVDENICSVSLRARNKDACLRELAQLVAASYSDLGHETILQGLVERESKGSTAFGEEIAIPHARIKDIDRFALSIGVSKKGLDFESLDKKKTKIFFTIIGPGLEQESYLKILAQVSRVAKNRYARRELLNARTPVALKETFFRYIAPDEVREHRDAASKKVLLITLYERKYLDDVIEVLISNDIKSISILDSRGTQSVLSNVPLFSEFINFTGERSDLSKTILAVVDRETVSRVIEGIETIMGDLNKHTGAMVLALDIFYMKGTLEVI
ncbi:MAG: PTS sugar transporter subunit IIA [Spirochaetes bacterium]|nr:PTS sugar transporter subunit IIA [Spirochaetota bacterium]